MSVIPLVTYSHDTHIERKLSAAILALAGTLKSKNISSSVPLNHATQLVRICMGQKRFETPMNSSLIHRPNEELLVWSVNQVIEFLLSLKYVVRYRKKYVNRQETKIRKSVLSN